ncbi:MAG: mucoidy inhibitor MuiA family protein, partial [Chloroflexota bacterium]
MEFPVEVTVSEVTIYPDRARVTCHGQCELPEGIHTIIVGELPLVLDPESVRATGMGTAQVRIRGVEIIQRYYVDTPDITVRELENQIEALQDQARSLTDRQSVWRSSIEHVNGLRGATKEFAWGLARGRTTTENQAILMRFFEEEDARIRQNIHDLEISERAVRDQLVKLQKELDSHQTARPRQRYEARLEVEILVPGGFEPELSYNVSRAGWRPLYDIRLEDASRTASGANLSFTSLAEIFQNTGQEWLGVELTVSTARPALNQRVPELKPWFIDVPRPQPRLAKSVAMAAMRESVQDYEEGDLAAPLMAISADAMPVAAEVDVAQIQESGTNVSFRVSGRIDIPGDGSTRKTTIGQYDFVPALDYLSIPRHTSAVYRRAKLISRQAFSRRRRRSPARPRAASTAQPPAPGPSLVVRQPQP